MTSINDRNFHVMIQHKSCYQVSNKVAHSETPDRHVTFHDQSESGYSTTTSSDDGQSSNSQLQTEMTTRSLKYRHTKHGVQVYPALGNDVKPQRLVLSQGYDNQKYHFDNAQANMTSVSMTPSPTSPLSTGSNPQDAYYYVGNGFDPQEKSYYDPLHLSHQADAGTKKGYWMNGQTHVDTDESTSESSSSKKRGILKKTNLSKSENNLYKSSHPQSDGRHGESRNLLLSQTSLPLNYGSPVKLNPLPNHENPIRVPAVYPVHAERSPSPPSSNDGYRKSAFTPVISRKHMAHSLSDLSDVSSHIFTPVKGPAVFDYVTSSEKINELGMTEGPFNPAQTLQPQYSPRNNLVRPQAQNHTCTHHSNNSFGQRVVERSAPLPNQTARQQSLIPPIPAPRKMIGNLNKDFDALHINGSRDSDSFTTDSGNSASPVANVETLTNDAVRLRHYLDISSAKELKKFLKEQLDSKDPKIIKALSTLIPVTVAKQVMSHCVRCHKNFNPTERSRCYMPHPEQMVFKVSQDEDGANFICQCCSTAFRLLKMDFYEESTNALLTGHCYSGQHTTDPESVDYRNDGGAAKSCEENGCVEFYV